MALGNYSLLIFVCGTFSIGHSLYRHGYVVQELRNTEVGSTEHEGYGRGEGGRYGIPPYSTSRSELPYHVTSYHIISYHTISYHIKYHIISYHIISNHIILCHIISYRVVSYHIMSHHTRRRVTLYLTNLNALVVDFHGAGKLMPPLLRIYHRRKQASRKGTRR